MQPVGVSGQHPAGGAQRLAVGRQALLVDGDRVLQREADLRAHRGGPRPLVVQVEGEHAHADGVQPASDDVQRRPLLGDEQHPFAVGDGPGEQVGDGLGLARSGRALQDERAAGGRLGDRP
jgi:hypothetical protein